MTDMRTDLPPGIPDRMKKLPLSDRGYPVPFFVQWVTEQGSNEPTPIGEGYPEFRIMRKEAYVRCVQEKRCWLCGEQLGRYMAFVAGPMCAVNRTSAEPPCHRDCAEWAAKACPFLSKPKMVRREAGLPEETVEAPGVAIKRNPGCALVWICEGYKLYPDGNGGMLFEMGPPTDVRWFAEGGDATREQIEESITTGLPLLEATFEEEPEDQRDAAAAELERRVTFVREKLLPVAA